MRKGDDVYKPDDEEVMRSDSNTDGKRCLGCGETLPLTDFHKDSTKRDGRHTRCRRCRVAAQRRYYARSGYAVKRAYDRTEQRRAVAREQRNDRYRRLPHEHAIRNSVAYAVQSGRIPAARNVPCSAGPDGCRGRHEWHHDSYLPEDALSVRCLCKWHHAEWHRENDPTRPPVA